MSQLIVYPFGSQEIVVPVGQKLAVATYGEGSCDVLSVPVSGNAAFASLVTTVSNAEWVSSASTSVTTYVLNAGADKVFYSVSSSPVAVQFIPSELAAGHEYKEDFDYYTSGNWTITAAGAGATQALADVDGGVLLLTNDTADDNNIFMQKKGESFLFEAGKDLWFEARVQISDATNSDMVLGLQITDTTPLAVTDGVYFLKSDDSTTVNLLVTKNSTSTTTAAGTMANATWTTLGFHYDGVSKIDVYFNRSLVATSAVTNLPDDEQLTVSFGVQNGAAASKTMSIDYIVVSKQR